MQRFHYFENDRIQWRWILIRWSGQVKHIVLFMMRSWLYYQKCLWVSTQHFPYLCCFGLTGSPVLLFPNLSLFQLWKWSQPVAYLNAWFDDSVLRTQTWTMQSWCEVSDIVGPAGSDVAKWHQTYSPRHGKRIEETGNPGQKSGYWNSDISIFPATYLINDPQLFFNATVFSADSQECWETWVTYVLLIHKIALVGFQRHLKCLQKP